MARGRRVRVSFDLDDTLICYGGSVPCEPRLPFLLRRLVYDEPLRRGARALMRELRRRGCDLWVYTTSDRNRWGVAWWLRLHGLRVAGVINQAAHARRNRPAPGYDPPSKNPRRFGIALHVDNLDGVRLEGERHGFKVVVIAPDDPGWADRVLRAVDDLQPGLNSYAENQAAP